MNATKNLLLAAAWLAATVLVSAAHAQIAFRSSSSNLISGGGPAIPALRAAAAGGAPMTIVGQSRAPASDDAVTTATSASITPPAGMQANDLILVFISAMVASSTPINYTSNPMAGQTWNLGTTLQNGSNPSTKVYASIFNGTWSGNPSFTWGSTPVTYQMWMVVLRGADVTLGTQYMDANCCGGSATEGRNTFAAPASPFNVTIPAGTFATSTDNAMVFAMWSSADDNTWALQTGGWTQPGGQPQWRTMAAAGGAGADSSTSIAYMSQATAGAIPALTNQQTLLGGDAGNWRIFAIRAGGIRKPPGTVAGDVMIATIAWGLDTVNITPPAGWNLVRLITSSSKTNGFHRMAVYYRVADASDASVSSYTFTFSSGPNGWQGGIQSFSGVDTASPIDVENGQITSVALTHATPSVTTTGTNRLIVTSHAVLGGTVTWTPPAGMTETLDFKNGKNVGGAVETSIVLQAAAGATGTKTATQSAATTYGGIAHILALRPASGGGSSTLTINKPAGVVQNDVMIASISFGPSTATINAPAGWTLVRRTDNASGTSNSLAVYSKLATATEAASYDWTLGAGHTGAAASIMAFAGADPVIEAENGQTTASGTSHATPTVATAYANTMLVASYGVGATSTWLPPGGMTETVDAQGGSQALEVSYGPQAAIAGSISKTATSSGTGTGNAHILALRRVTGAFNAFDTTTALGALSGNIKTKVAGTSVTLATIALNPPKTAVATTFLGTVKVDVLDASDNSGVLDANTKCNSSWTVLQPLPDITFGVADNGRKNVSFTVANAYRNVRLKLSYPASAPDTFACSSDNFAIRPDQFVNILVTDADWQTAGTGRALTNTATTGGNVHKAGRPFTIRASAVNGDGTGTTKTTNYIGTPTATVTQCGAGGACSATVGALTVGGSSVAGDFTSTVASYPEAASFALKLVDSTFAQVDDTDGSTAAEHDITTLTAVNVGRFVPDRFEFAVPSTPQLQTFGTASCGSRSFTYIGQPFWYVSGSSPSATLNAVNAAGAVTTNYTLNLASSKPAISETYADAGAPALAPLNSTLKGTPSLPAGAGTGTYSVAGAGSLSYTRTTSATGTVPPFSSAISLSVTASDATEAGVTGNGTITTATPLVFNGTGTGIAFDSGNSMRFGRLAVRNANGSQLVPLRVPLETQYWNGNAFVTNVADSCTRLDGVNIEMANYQGTGFAPAPNCKTRLPSTAVTFDAIAFAQGRALALLTPPTGGVMGSVDLTVRLEQSPTAQTCIAATAPASVQGENATYLQGNWSTSTFTQNPSAKATFGVYKGADEVIYVRENF